MGQQNEQNAPNLTNVVRAEILPVTPGRAEKRLAFLLE
jgi:hypothetical protein